MNARLERHRQTLGALHLALGVTNLIACLIVWAVLAGIIGLAGEPQLSGILGSVGGIVGIILLLAATPCVVAGYGILRERPWGRSAALISAILALPALFLGTAVAVYTFWVLMNDHAAETDR